MKSQQRQLTLRRNKLPAPDAGWDDIQRFALTSDGYAWAGGVEERSRLEVRHKVALVEELLR